MHVVDHRFFDSRCRRLGRGNPGTGLERHIQGGIKQLLKAHGVTVFEGTAAFEGRNKLSINGSTVIESAKTIIATGSTSVVPVVETSISSV